MTTFTWVYYDNYKDFYLESFQLMNVSAAGPYVKNFYITKDKRKTYFAISQHFMGDDAIKRAKKKPIRK